MFWTEPASWVLTLLAGSWPSLLQGQAEWEAGGSVNSWLSGSLSPRATSHLCPLQKRWMGAPGSALHKGVRRDCPRVPAVGVSCLLRGWKGVSLRTPTSQGGLLSCLPTPSSAVQVHSGPPDRWPQGTLNPGGRFCGDSSGAEGGLDQPDLLFLPQDLTGGAFEDNLRSLHLQEGRDFLHFS